MLYIYVIYLWLGSIFCYWLLIDICVFNVFNKSTEILRIILYNKNDGITAVVQLRHWSDIASTKISDTIVIRDKKPPVIYF